jgi:hypothetical protein
VEINPLHAETIQSIWASRCKKVFDDEVTHSLELKAKLIAQIEYRLTIHANILSKKPRKPKAFQHSMRIWTQNVYVASITATKKLRALEMQTEHISQQTDTRILVFLCTIFL